MTVFGLGQIHKWYVLFDIFPLTDSDKDRTKTTTNRQQQHEQPVQYTAIQCSDLVDGRTYKDTTEHTNLKQQYRQQHELVHVLICRFAHWEWNTNAKTKTKTSDQDQASSQIPHPQMLKCCMIPDAKLFDANAEMTQIPTSTTPWYQSSPPPNRASTASPGASNVRMSTW